MFVLRTDLRHSIFFRFFSLIVTQWLLSSHEIGFFLPNFEQKKFFRTLWISRSTIQKNVNILSFFLILASFSDRIFISNLSRKSDPFKQLNSFFFLQTKSNNLLIYVVLSHTTSLLSSSTLKQIYDWFFWTTTSCNQIELYI